MKLAQARCATIFADTFSARAKTLRVDVEGDEIIVRRPGTALMLAYSKSAEQLFKRRSAKRASLSGSLSRSPLGRHLGP
jgi:hypothetical protein